MKRALVMLNVIYLYICYKLGTIVQKRKKERNGMYAQRRCIYTNTFIALPEETGQMNGKLSTSMENE